MGCCPRAGIFETESTVKKCDGNRKGRIMEEKRKNTMILYRNLRYQQLFDDMCSLLKPEEGEARPDAYACASQLIDLAVTYGFRGNLWHCFLAFCMANNENAYSTSCEIIGPVGGSLSELARHDFTQVRELFSLDIARLDETENGIWSEMKHYENALENSKAFNHRIRDRIVELSVSLENAESDQEFQDPFEDMMKVHNAGAIFLGENSSEPLGDYFAGPNHILPTNGTAKFFSPLSVDDFVKKSSIIYYSREALSEIHEDIESFAKSESLTAHANSIAVRFEGEE